MKNGIPQSHQPHFKCYRVSCGQWLPYWAMLLQYSCLENPVDRGAWWGAVHRVAWSRTQVK